MKRLPFFTEIVNNLANHANSMRIKKLLFCACTNKWENDPNIINNLSLPDLLQELRRRNPSLDSFKNALYKVAETLNKKAEYYSIAHTILMEIDQLYPANEETIKTSLLNSNSSTPSVLSPPPETSKQPAPPDLNQPTRAFDAFELRFDVMKLTNPLRAKIVAFSALYDQFDFSETHWSQLRTKDLDELLERLFRTHENIRELQLKLEKTARNSSQPNENILAANAIIKSMKPYYDAPPSETENPDKLDDNMPATQAMMEIGKLENNQEPFMNDEENTCQLLAAPPKDWLKNNKK